jgi:hypothetical protein
MVYHLSLTMSTVSISDLHTAFPMVEAMLNAGEEASF